MPASTRRRAIPRWHPCFDSSGEPWTSRQFLQPSIRAWHPKV